MTGYDHVFSAAPNNFAALVLENSARGPVMVNYWSPRAGPCMVLMPRLIRLAAEYGGRFLLVTVNTDEHALLARGHGVYSVPTVKMFHHGKIVDTVYGALADTEFRSLIDRYIVRESASVHALAIAEHRAGNDDRALTLLTQAVAADPRNARIAVDLAKLLILGRKPVQAESVLDGLSEETRSDPQIATLRAHLGFLRAAAAAPAQEELEQELRAHPENIDARYALSALKLVEDDYAGAMDELIEILRRDRGCNAARLGLLAVFQILGNESELLTRYRTYALEVMD